LVAIEALTMYVVVFSSFTSGNYGHGGRHGEYPLSGVSLLSCRG